MKALDLRKDEIMDLGDTGLLFCENNTRGWAVDRRYETRELTNPTILRIFALKISMCVSLGTICYLINTV